MNTDSLEFKIPARILDVIVGGTMRGPHVNDDHKDSNVGQAFVPIFRPEETARRTDLIFHQVTFLALPFPLTPIAGFEVLPLAKARTNFLRGHACLKIQKLPRKQFVYVFTVAPDSHFFVIAASMTFEPFDPRGNGIEVPSQDCG